MMKHFKPLPAQSAGLITNYRCTFKCAHCLYCASPNIDENIQDASLEELIHQIDRVLGPIPLHIGGGEPLLHFDRIKHLLSVLRNTDIIVEYVETNGSSLLNQRRQKLLALQREGLERLLVSISPFHNAFINLNNLKAVIRDIVDIYGTRGLFPWHTGYLAYLERFSPHETVAVDDYFSRFSRAEIQHQLTSVMYIHPGGRGAYFLAKHLPVYPVEAVLEKNCREFLASPVHAHLDYRGNYLTGFCSGLRIGEEMGFSLEALFHTGIALSPYPILEILVHKGIRGLYEHARNAGYTPRNGGYISACHLCLDIRIHLYFHEERYPELYPEFLYQELRF
jgi:hypothetical protein